MRELAIGIYGDSIHSYTFHPVLFMDLNNNNKLHLYSAYKSHGHLTCKDNRTHI